jgi:lipoyl(octanoyl) transferase
MSTKLETCRESMPLAARTVCRLLPWSVADGATNMATDEALLESAASGVASLRFYAWDEATVSLGYFQPQADRQHGEVVGSLPYVRRPSGGDALVHHHEVTYALALPAPQVDRAPSWLCRMHHVIRAALSELGISAELSTEEKRVGRFLCFGHQTPGDLLIESSKVVGSAQRRHRGAVLQHGAILLAASPHTPSLPGIAELSGIEMKSTDVVAAVSESFASATGWVLEPGDWGPAKTERIRFLIETKYRQASWNDKR